MKILKEKGNFYLPSDKQRKIPGILTFTNEKGTNVELIGMLSPPPSSHLIVQGNTSHGDSLTLYQTYDTNFTFGTKGFNTSNLYSRYLFRGLQFDSQNDLYFRRIEARFNLLTDWLNVRKSFDIVIDKNSKTTTITQKPTEKIEFQLPNDVMLEIYLYSNINFDGVPIKGASIKQESCIEFNCHKRMRFDYLMDLLKHFQNFITFCTLKTTYPTEVDIYFRTRGEKQFRKAEVSFPISYLKEYDSNNLNQNDFVIAYTTIEHKFEYVIYRWFKIREKLNPIISEFCSVYYTPSMFPEDKFLSITRCLESFHREFRNSKDITIFKRYHELYKEGRLTFNMILKEKSSIKFCERLKKIRNDFTHNNPKNNKAKRNIRELLKMTEKARIIFISALLREIGLTNKEIRARFLLSRPLTK